MARSGDREGGVKWRSLVELIAEEELGGFAREEIFNRPKSPIPLPPLATHLNPQPH